MSLENFLGWIKLRPVHLAPLALISGILIFGPDAFLNYLGVAALLAKYRAWVGLAFLLFTCLLVAHFAFWLKDATTPKIREYRTVRLAKKALRHLSPKEKRALSGYIIHHTKSRTFGIGSGVASSLESARIIYSASSIGNFRGFSYNLQPWAWEELNKHPEILEPELSLRKKQGH